MKTSNKFTLSRLIFAPIFFLLYYIPIWTNNQILAFISSCIMIPSLIIAQITDYWDGHYARKYNEVGDFGKLFDPFADVMLNLTTFLCATHSFSEHIGSFMPITIFVLIMYREFGQSFLRMLATKQGIAIAARKSGKVKTVFYIIATFFMLAVESLSRLCIAPWLCGLFNIDQGIFFFYAKIVVQVFYVVCVILSYSSFFDYIKNFKSVFKEV